MFDIFVVSRIFEASHCMDKEMNQRFYIEYLKEERKDVLKSLQDQNIKEYLLTENYEKLDSIFEEIKQQLF